jgi:hypothetical protein
MVGKRMRFAIWTATALSLLAAPQAYAGSFRANPVDEAAMAGTSADYRVPSNEEVAGGKGNAFQDGGGYQPPQDLELIDETKGDQLVEPQSDGAYVRPSGASTSGLGLDLGGIFGCGGCGICAKCTGGGGGGGGGGSNLVPEPSSALLMGVGLGAMSLLRRRKARRAADAAPTDEQ